jgi:hypothetical protein
LVATIVAIGLFRSTGYLDYLLRLNRQRVRVRSAETEQLRRFVPPALTSFAASTTESRALATVEEFLTCSGLASAELVDENDATLRAWSPQPEVSGEDLVSARFPIGPDSAARASIVFRWQSTERQVSPQSEILLQVTVDALADALTRSRSTLAPRTREETSAPDPTEVASQGAGASA